MSSPFAQTEAGVEIKNLATVTYQDANGNEYSAQSNESVVTVKQVYSAELGSDIDKPAAPGQPVYVQYTLQNTGNGIDTYALAVADLVGEYGDTIDADSIKIFLDEDGDGQASSGEQEISEVTLEAGEKARLAIEIAIPNDASAALGDKLGIRLTASTVNGTVTDITSGKGRDGADGTNETLITVTGDAVLNYTKKAVHDVANNQITYTLEVTNTGNKAAKDVLIFDGLPDQTTFVSATTAGIISTNTGDVEPNLVALTETGTSEDLNADGDIADDDEASLGVDLNNDGDQVDAGVQGIFAKDAELLPNATISISFTVQYDPMTYDNNADGNAYGDVIENIAYLTADIADNGTPVGPSPTNPVEVPIPQMFGALAEDTDENTGDTVNDGLDDDGDNDSQFVSQVPAGSTVLFNVAVTNKGNGEDTLELSVDRGTFPVGTTFTLWNADGSVQLTNTNGEFSVDSGELDQDGVLNIQVKAKLPANVNGDNGGAGFIASLTATSSSDPAVVPASDATSLTLGEIVAPAVDLDDDGANAADPGVNSDELSKPAEYELTGRGVFSGSIAGTVNIPLYIDNDSGASDSFQIAAGSQWDGATLGGLPDGWDVKFYAGDGNGNPVGGSIASTDLLPGGYENYEIIAVVSLPDVAAYALADASYDSDNDSVMEVLDPNSDGDGDYPIFFQITSENTGAMDIMLDAVDVNSVRELSLTPPGANQIQAGGSVDYEHNLENVGNTDETVELTAGNNQADWNNVIKVDTDCDGVADTSLGNLQDGDSVCGQDQEGSDVLMSVSGSADGNPDITVPAGVNVPLMATVFAPSKAPAGQVDVLTVSATNLDATGPSLIVEDTSTIILGQVRLDKTAAYDPDCDGEPDSPFEVDLSMDVAPQECAVWQIKAENQGDATVKNVIITDAVTSYADYLPNSMRYCLTDACVPAAVTDTPADDNGEVDAEKVTFYLGTGIDAAAGLGGDMIAGEKATVRFGVRVK